MIREAEAKDTLTIADLGNIENTLGGITHKVHMQQVFGTDNYYIQDEGRGHEV